jgi:hypothetical protein
MKCYVFVSEPAGSEYADLIDFCCSLASKMILVVRDPQIRPGDAIRQRLAKLQPYRIEALRSREWPGTILYEDEAAVYWHHVTPGLQQCMKELASHLFEWVHPDAPEDPCFFRDDGQVVLVTISHERDAYLMLTEAEFVALEERFPGLAAILRKEG